MSGNEAKRIQAKNIEDNTFDHERNTLDAEQRKVNKVVEKNLAHKNYKGLFVQDAKKKFLDSSDNENYKVIRDEKNMNRNNSDAKKKNMKYLEIK